jgi:DNA-binding NarL/FixJ family response regulator
MNISEISEKRNPCRILIIEDHPLFREGLKFQIDEEENLTVCGEADSIATALKQVNLLEPDLAVVDIALKGRSGLDLIQEIKAIKPDMLILVVSMFNETAYVARALKAGARGYIVKDESAKEVVAAIYSVMRGELAVSEPHRTRIMEGQVNPSTSDTLINVQDALTNRELEIFRCIGEGKSRKEISADLNLSEKTISNYREKIKDKLGLKHSAELAMRAVQWVEKQKFRG